MGRDAYGSTQLPNVVEQAQTFFRSLQPPKFTDATIVNEASPPERRELPTTGLEEWDHKMEKASAKSRAMLLRGVRWPLARDPPGVSEHPFLTARVSVTLFATLTTRYLHLYQGFSPVLASSAMTLLVSSILDPRLGQAALCGSLAGMSGGRLAPTLSAAALLGALTSLSYEVLIHINDLFLGIGGRLGATAFLATSLFAKYRGIGHVGRRLRRGLWKTGTGVSGIAVSMVLYHVLGSVATIFLREASDDSGAADPIRASAVVGLLGALFLQDPTAILAVQGGSFVGMSLPSRLVHGNVPSGDARARTPRTTATALLSAFAGAGASAGLWHAAAMHSGYWTGGWGGKVGLCAFAGCWTYRAVDNTLRFVQRRQ